MADLEALGALYAHFESSCRISKTAVLGSTGFLFGLVVICFGYRMYIRLAVHKVFQADDGCIAFGVILLIVALGALYYYIDEMYLVEGLLQSTAETGFEGLASDNNFSLIPPDVLDFRKWVAVSLSLTWTTITAVKFSFLALFRRLIFRLPALQRYWWCVCAYTVIVYIYGFLTYFVPFDGFYDLHALTTEMGGTQYHLTIATATSQLVLDIVGDVLILIIPIKLIWQIHVRWTQKLALMFSLCLSLVLVAVTITRASGLKMGDTVDVVWEVYWQFISAEVGLILSSATAFRSLFVAGNGSASQPPSTPLHSHPWAQNLLRKLSGALTPMRWTRKSERLDTPTSAPERSRVFEGAELPQVPRALMTGLRSFIGRHSEERDEDDVMCLSPPLPRSQILVSHTIEVSYSDNWPLAELPTTHSRQSPVAELV